MGRADPRAIGALRTARLLGDARHRLRRGELFVEGLRFVLAAADGGATLRELIYSRRLLKGSLARRLVSTLRSAGVACHAVTPEQFRSVSRARHASGLAAIVEQPWTPLARASPDAGSCWVAVREVRSPGNLGTVLRTADAVGAAGLITLGAADPFDPGVVRGSMGSVFRQRLVRTSPDRFRAWTQQHGCTVVGASPSAAASYRDFAFPERTVLLLGEEREGLAAADERLCDRLVHIPMVGTVDSLNLGVAAGLLLYEVARSRAPPFANAPDPGTLRPILER